MKKVADAKFLEMKLRTVGENSEAQAGLIQMDLYNEKAKEKPY